MADGAVREARRWLGALEARRAFGLVDPPELEARLRADLAAAEQGTVPIETRVPAVVVIERVAVPAPVRRQVKPPPQRCLHASGCQGWRGTHPRFCWVHRTPAEQGPHRRIRTVPLLLEPLEEVVAPSVVPDRLVRAKPCCLTAEDAWAQTPGSGWQGGPVSVGWHWEVQLRAAQPPTSCACGSRALIWNGRAWWCEDCDARVEPEDPGADKVAVWDVNLPATASGVAPADEDADYRAATRLFHAGAVTHRPYGWIAPRWDRWKEGKPQCRR